MKQEKEIYDIIYNRLGLKNLEAYKNYCESFYKDPIRVVSQEEIDLLSPDGINNYAFWRVAEELFKTDPVSNCLFKGEFSITQANRNNLDIYLLDGIIPLIQYFQKYGYNKNIFEIGPGYGALKNWVETNTLFSYNGVDSYPKVKGIHETDENGLMKQETVELFKEKIDFCVASNVFQHLSVRQRNQYYKDVATLLSEKGIFAVSQFHDNPNNPYCRSADGRMWLRHYGQFTEIQKSDEIYNDIGKYFNIDSTTYKSGWMVLFLRKKAIKIAEAPIIPIEVEKAA